jgi:hypothetical protein
MKISELVNVDVAYLQEPTPRQVNNYLLNTFKTKILDKSHFNYGELYKWVQQRTQIPFDEHEPFILAHFFNINDRIPFANSFKFRSALSFWFN